MYIVAVLVLVYLYKIGGGNSSEKAKIKRHKRYLTRAKRVYKRLGKYPPATQFKIIREVNPYVFEELLLYAFKRIGFKIKRSKSYSGDGGIDGQVKINGDWYLIQAKRYNNHIDSEHVKAFRVLCDQYRKQGFFIHSGKTGRKALSESGQVVDIISGSKLLKLMELGRKRRSLFDRGYLQQREFTVIYNPLKKEKGRLKRPFPRN